MKVCDMRNFQRMQPRRFSFAVLRSSPQATLKSVAIPRQAAAQPRAATTSRGACAHSSACGRAVRVTVPVAFRIGLAPRRHVHNIGQWFASSCHARRACPSESASGAQRALWLARMAASLRPSRCRRTSSYSRFLARRSRARPRASAIGAWALSDIRRHNSSSSHTLLLLLPPFPLGGCI
jgi:hypothetical protein